MLHEYKAKQALKRVYKKKNENIEFSKLREDDIPLISRLPDAWNVVERCVLLLFSLLMIV
jgi:hypothetical protein